MDFEEEKKRPSFFWIYLILFIFFVIWVMVDDTDNIEEELQTIEIELPRKK